MLKFNRNKSQTFKCKIDIQGADNPNVVSRLILSPKNNNMKLFFEGKYLNNNCEIEIPAIANIPTTGEAILEIIANDTVFQPWKSEYEILSESVVVEAVELIDNKKNIVVSVIQEKQNVKAKSITENYYQGIKKLKHKKSILEHIKNSYKPKQSILEWAKKEFNDTESIKSKMAMYCKEKKII